MKKGQAPQAYLDGKIDKHNFRNLPEDKLKEISAKGVAKRKENREQKLALQECMKALLSAKVTTQKQRNILKEYGFEKEQLQNQQLLMVALFRKGITGDVSAIKEIREMVTELGLDEEKEEQKQTGVTINLIAKGKTTVITSPEEEQDIWEAENGIIAEDNMEEEWGTDVYEG